MQIHLFGLLLYYKNSMCVLLITIKSHFTNHSLQATAAARLYGIGVIRKTSRRKYRTLVISCPFLKKNPLCPSCQSTNIFHGKENIIRNQEMEITKTLLRSFDMCLNLVKFMSLDICMVNQVFPLWGPLVILFFFFFFFLGLLDILKQFFFEIG